ncbi:nanos homolog 3 isoform X2 [Cricetulus griseus]|uniref:Nanos homolog 3 isoform X2 n=1 Tax=Cricetulus griseus TaxID=10029 RepID=A0A9J7K745_CRIGR|nr:nanos homolog 3 isoform X2 [Cricetulus griseus]
MEGVICETGLWLGIVSSKNIPCCPSKWCLPLPGIPTCVAATPFVRQAGVRPKAPAHLPCLWPACLCARVLPPRLEGCMKPGPCPRPEFPASRSLERGGLQAARGAHGRSWTHRPAPRGASGARARGRGFEPLGAFPRGRPGGLPGPGGAEGAAAAETRFQKWQEVLWTFTLGLQSLHYSLGAWSGEDHGVPLPRVWTQACWRLDLA